MEFGFNADWMVLEPVLDGTLEARRRAQILQNFVRGWRGRLTPDFVLYLCRVVSVHRDRHWMAVLILSGIESWPEYPEGSEQSRLMASLRMHMLLIAGYVRLATGLWHQGGLLREYGSPHLEMEGPGDVLDTHELRRFINSLNRLPPVPERETPAILENLDRLQVFMEAVRGGLDDKPPRDLIRQGAALVIDFSRDEFHSARFNHVVYGIPMEVRLAGLIRALQDYPKDVTRGVLVNEMWNEPTSRTLLDMRFQKMVSRIEKIYEIPIELRAGRSRTSGPAVVKIKAEALGRVVVLSPVVGARPSLIEKKRRTVSVLDVRNYYGLSQAHAWRLRRQFIKAGWLGPQNPSCYGQSVLKVPRADAVESP